MLKPPIIGNHSWYANDMGVQIVAVQGEVNDWAAYIGGVSYYGPEEEAMEQVRRHGCKLDQKTAEFFFPSIVAGSHGDLKYRP